MAEASEVEGKAYFKAALTLMDEGMPEYAAKNFILAKEQLTIIKDYPIYYLALAYESSGNERKAVNTLELLLKEYPQSPLKQKAQRKRILILRSLDAPETFKALHRYLRFNPSDLEIHFLYGLMLKEMGKKKIADKVFLHIYANAKEFSDEAFEQLEDKRISNKVLKLRAENFIEQHAYAKAEPILLTLINTAKNSDKDRFIEDYALSLFRQRKYPQAAIQYLSIDDKYNAARAFLRAGEKLKFYSTLDDMVNLRDKNAGKLLIACAEDARRNGDTADAIDILTDAITKFPDTNENALWSKGWLLYRTGQYSEAMEVFKFLYEEHRSNQYLYWLARSVENNNGDPSPLYDELNGDDYYSYLAHLQNKKVSSIINTSNIDSNKEIDFRRVDFLFEMKLIEHAIMELEIISHRARYYSEYIQIARKFAQAGQYKRSLVHINMIPENSRPQEILYPLAFWDNIEDTASLYKIDPFLLISLIREESHFDNTAFSAAGAIGLMQLMPATAKSTAKKIDLNIEDREDISDIENNIRLGTHYLNGLLEEFESVPPALAAYNAGERRVRSWLKRGKYSSYDEFIEDIPFKETRNYVKRILKTYYRYKLSAPATDIPETYRIL